MGLERCRLLSIGTAFAIFTLLLPLAGCTHSNVRLNPPELTADKWQRNQTRAGMELRAPAQSEAENDGVFVGLALSGGGSRSANFSAACLFELQRLGILQRVDAISSVSGGSLTAAYYCTHGDDWNPAEAQKRLTHSFANDVIFQTFLPWNLLALTFTDWDRGDLLSDSFQKKLYTRDGRALTFGDLRPDRPRLLINATDLQSGRRFVFTNEAFDRINSDLSRYPIADAVAASSAVPVLVHHLTVRDFSTIFKQYVHLMDGGIVDNLGIRTLVEMYDQHQESARRQGLPSPYPRGAIFIVIDAKVAHDADLSHKGDMGLFETVAMGTGLASTALLERASSATLADTIVQYSPPDITAQELRQQIQTLEDSGYLEVIDRDGQQVRVLHLALTRVKRLPDQPYESFGSSVNNIATYFNIGTHEAHNLYVAARLLVERMFNDELGQIAAYLQSPDAPAAAAQAEASK